MAAVQPLTHHKNRKSNPFNKSPWIGWLLSSSLLCGALGGARPINPQKRREGQPINSTNAAEALQFSFSSPSRPLGRARWERKRNWVSCRPFISISFIKSISFQSLICLLSIDNKWYTVIILFYLFNSISSKKKWNQTKKKEKFIFLLICWIEWMNWWMVCGLLHKEENNFLL